MPLSQWEKDGQVIKFTTGQSDQDLTDMVEKARLRNLKK